MKLLGTENLTIEEVQPEVTASTADLLKDLHHAEVESYGIENFMETDEVLTHTGDCTIESLSSISDLLADKEIVDQLTYESLRERIHTSSELTGIAATLDDYNPEEYTANKDILLTELETTVEGFIGDIVGSVATVTKRIVRATGSFVTALTTRQGLITKLATKLEKKMAKYEAGDVAGKTVKSPGVSKWFKSPEDALDKLKMYSGLRAAANQVQANLNELGNLPSEADDELDSMQGALQKNLERFAAVDGVDTQTKAYPGGAQMTGVTFPTSSGKTFAIAGVTTGVVATGAAAAALLTAAAPGAKAAIATSSSTALVPYIAGTKAMSISTAFMAKGASAKAALGAMPKVLMVSAKAMLGAQYGTMAGAAIVAGSAVGAIALLYGTYRALAWVMSPRVAAMEYGEVEGVLSSIIEMGKEKMSLKGLSGTLARIESKAKGLKSTSNFDKSTIKALVKSIVRLLAGFNSVIKKIYSDSVSVTKAGYSYAVKSLKAHNKAGQSTEANDERDAWGTELDQIIDALDGMDKIGEMPELEIPDAANDQEDEKVEAQA